MFPKFQFFSEKPADAEQGQSLQTSPQPKLLCLKGETGTLACRVHDPLLTNILPQRSKPWGRLRYAWLSEEKMHNLIAVRGNPGASMVGPADYFCDLERSDQYLYTIDINSEGVPKFTQHPLDAPNYKNPTPAKTLSEDQITKVNAKWFSGFDKEAIRAKKAEYKESSAFGGNLFPNSGILEIDAPKEIALQAFDPRDIDLSEFKARLVPNDVPFQITAERLHVDDEYCAISYQYDAGYADEQVKSGGGMFLEFHEFAQTITPMEQDAKGFVTLAKWNKKHTQLELVAIRIPYGYTLIVEKKCIHGDTTLDGLYLMCMTSDHISMATADTVFLKHAASKENITLKLDNNLNSENHLKPHRLLNPLVIYDKNRKTDLTYFNKRTQGMDVIFTPTQGYWEVKKQTIGNVGIFLLAGACLITAALMPHMLILFIVMLSCAALFAGAGLYNTLKQSEIREEDSLMPKAYAV